MGSRIRDNVEHFFECFCEVVPPTEKEAWILQKFPDKYRDEQVLKSVPQFAYPYKFENTVIEHYSFVLTDVESKWTYGFCRHDPKSETAIVVLSYLPWHHAFYKFLDKIAVLMHSSRTEDLGEFLTTVYNTKLSSPGKKFVIPFNRGESSFEVEVPRPFQLPSIPENKNLTEYYNALDPHKMMIIFASMLYERRIIFTSNKLKRLSACVQAANDVLYPMIWQHIFIPVLPMALVDYLLAPMPFLIGVPDEVLKKVQRHEIGDVVILNADTNTVETPFDDLNSLPQEVVASLKKQFRNKSALLGDGVPRAFLRALVQLIGGYRDALKFQPGQKVTFDEQKFIETRPLSLQPFLREMLHLQIFQQFIEERLLMLNTGRGFSDEFEYELEEYSAKTGSKLRQQYKEWTSTMRKEGSAFFKSVKDKANPAMKSAVKSVKVGGKGMKSAYKELRSRLKENQTNGIEVIDGRDKPRSAPNSPTGKRKPLTSFGVPAATYRKDLKSATVQRSYSPLSPSSQPATPDVLDTPRSSSPIEIPRIDLMNEMQDLLQLRLDTTPPVDRSLKPVRSLENFRNVATPLSSPEHNSIFHTKPLPQLKTGLPSVSPPTRLFPNIVVLPTAVKSQEMQNLLQSPDDVFLSPPSVPPRNSITTNPNHGGRDLFGTTPFIVGGGHSENGDPLFYVANQHTVDIVKLSPPTCSPRRKKGDDTEDLIRLDSTSSDIDDFDPLKSDHQSKATTIHQGAPLSVTNPLYLYENHTLKTNGSLIGNNNVRLGVQNDISISSRNDQDLLHEYGLDFNFSSLPSHSSSLFDPFSISDSSTGNSVSSSKVCSKGQWTKFE